MIVLAHTVRRHKRASPVADYQRMAAAVTCVTVLLTVVIHLTSNTARIIQRPFLRPTHPAPWPSPGSPSFLLRSDYRHHRHAFPRPAIRYVRVIVYPEKYAVFSPSFHNF